MVASGGRLTAGEITNTEPAEKILPRDRNELYRFLVALKTSTHRTIAAAVNDAYRESFSE